MHDPDANKVAPLEQFMGSHSELGGWQSHPFALVPRDWGEPREAIVRVSAMHDTIRGWLAESELELKPHEARSKS
jgi:hypothetical protein